MSGTKPPCDGTSPTPEEQDAQLWAGVRRQESSWAGLFAAVLVLLPLYFAGLNAYVLNSAVPRPLRLSLEVPAGAQMRGAYQPRLIWKPMKGSAEAVRPLVWIDGEALREGLTRLAKLLREFSPA